MYAILVKIWELLKLLNSVPFIKKTLVNQVYIGIRSFWLTSQFYSEWRQTSKLINFSRFLVRSDYVIQVKIGKWLILLKSATFIKKTIVNQVYIQIWWFWLTFTVLQWMKENYNISQFSSFLLRSWCAI